MPRNVESTLRWALGVAVLALLALLAALAFRGRTMDGAKMRLLKVGSLPSFELLSSTGKPWGRKDLLGKVTVFAFIYTRCGSSCPMITSQMQKAQTAFRDRPGVQFASLTVDPTHDTPTVLARFAAERRLDLGNWALLTGEPEAVYALIEKGFKAPVQKMVIPGDQGLVEIPHSTSLVIVDREGVAWGYFEGILSSDWPRLRDGVERLLKDPS